MAAFADFARKRLTMLSRDKPPISERRTDLSSPADVGRRLLFAFVMLGAPTGGILLLYGLTQHRSLAAIVGGSILLLALVAWWRRGASLNATAEEVRKNPFKPRRGPGE